MSGGSMNYFYCTLEEYENALGDRELNELVHDLVKVFHDKEWLDSADMGEGEYNKTVIEFKDKWFADAGKHERYLSYIDDAVRELKRELRLDRDFCKDCKRWQLQDGYIAYGKCEFHEGCLTHGYDYAPHECFERRGKNNGRRKADTADNT